MSLSQFDSFQSRFVTYLLNFPRSLCCRIQGRDHIGNSKCRWQDKIKAKLKEKEGWRVLDLAGSGKG